MLRARLLAPRAWHPAAMGTCELVFLINESYLDLQPTPQLLCALLCSTDVVRDGHDKNAFRNTRATLAEMAAADDCTGLHIYTRAVYRVVTPY